MDIHEYRQQLVEKLAAVDAIIAEMDKAGGAAVPKRRGRKVKANDGGEIPVPFGKGRRKMSAAGRARIAAAQKARWAALKAKKAAK